MEMKTDIRPFDNTGTPMLARHEICKLLGVGTTWLQKQCNPKKVRQPIPYRKVGKFMWFVKQQVDE